MSDVVLNIDGFAKTFRKPFTGRQVHAVKSVSLSVERGQIFGFLGPNGAGKTTTIKMLTGLIRPTRGKASLLGVPAPSPEAMGRIGFLPENPYIYPYLTPREFVALTGRLNGLRGAALDTQVDRALERTGVAYAADRAVRALSKGMTQRVGLASALVHQPELLILDEPMSGLDPVGRKEVRDLILEERNAGRTVFFSSHVLSDVEMLCDHVTILRLGEVVVEGALRDLLKTDSRRSEVALDTVSEAAASKLRAVVPSIEVRDGRVIVELEGTELLRDVLQIALAEGAHVESVSPKRETLEAIFVRKAF